MWAKNLVVADCEVYRGGAAPIERPAKKDSSGRTARLHIIKRSFMFAFGLELVMRMIGRRGGLIKVDSSLFHRVFGKDFASWS